MLVAEHHLSAAIKSILRKCGMEGDPARARMAGPSTKFSRLCTCTRIPKAYLCARVPLWSHCSSIGPELCGGDIANDEIIVRNDVPVGHFEHR